MRQPSRLCRRALRLAAALGLITAVGVGVSAQQSGRASLKDAAPKSLLIGAAINQQHSDGLDQAATALIEAQFSTISPENLLKWGPLHPEPDRYNWEPADRYVAYGTTRKLAVIGHTLVWHQQTARWVFQGPDGKPADRETLLARMKAHIETVVGRYKGQIRGWDVVNEALEEDGTLRKSPWLNIIGEDFIAKAFEYAHAADPNAELYYNDYNLTVAAKRQGAIRIVKDLKARGLRVDGIGEQGHWLIDQPSVADIDATLRDIKAAGVKAYITELDVDVLPRDPAMFGADLSKRAAFKDSTNLYPNDLPADQQERLARRYAEIFKVFLAYKGTLGRVTFWGLNDQVSWLNNFPVRGRTNYPLLWNRQGQPKPAFDAVLAVLKGSR